MKLNLAMPNCVDSSRSLHFGLVGFRTRLPKKGLVSPGLKNGFSKHEAEFGHAEPLWFACTATLKAPR